MDVYNYVVVQDKTEKKPAKIIEEGTVLTLNPKAAEKKVIAELENYNEGMTILIAPFCGKEIC